ncbi:fungal-specific transcription factor domain-containing protein [Thelonectria olida]|uniref:Fungal-specific transcription factor domain-containing protein n=1 Tax=Thelonectria olida TaxID=1576542 RepID=A0A9P9AR63_9HYPO|nr:fungal-specific transcription factor domain-containing protein [Thelonectria olida]
MPSKPKASSPSAAGSRRSGRSCKARSLACRECRDRKIRCDGGRPTCDSCRRRGLGAQQCVYPEIEHEGSIASSRSYIRVLQKRVQELEAREQQLLAVRNLPVSAGSSPVQDDAWAKPFTSPGTVPLQPKPVKPSDNVLPPIHAELSGFPSAPGSLPMPHEPSSYYSYPSAHMGTSPPLTDDLEDVSPIKSSFGSYSTNVKAALMLEKITLPAPGLIDDLLGEYFELDWITMPIVHRPTFIQRYHRLMAVSNSRYRRDIPPAEATELSTTYCLLLGMLAIGQLSKHDNPTPTETSTATDFHQQAKALLLSDLVSVPSLPVVQALLVHARFLRRSGALRDSWVFTGLAHRLAEGLLLHLDLPTKTVSEREERRRTWCSCVLMMRPDFGVLPAEIDDELMDSLAYNDERSQSPETPSWTSFFVQMLKLSDMVLRPVQEYFFDSPETEDAISEILSTALRIDDGLQDWHNSLPRHLQVDSICSQNQMGLRRQALLLHMRYLETKALLSRATIMKLVQRHPGKHLTGMSKTLVGGVIDACCTSGIELMDLMAREKDLLVLAGTPKSNMVISLCVIGMTLSMLLKMPILSGLIRNPATHADDTRRCLSLSKQFYTCRDQLAEKHIQVFGNVIQPQARYSMPSGVVDPALEARVLPVLRGDRGEPTNNASKLGGSEMVMLEAWYMGVPASVEGLSICEVLSLW